MVRLADMLYKNKAIKTNSVNALVKACAFTQVNLYLQMEARENAYKQGAMELSQLLKHSLVGKPEDIAQKIRKYIDAGIDQFFLAFQDPFEYEAIQLFMNTMKGFM